MDVSVIMPSFNVDGYIGEAIESIISQKFHGTFELVISDDCSTDRTKEIIQSYAQKYPDIIKVIYKNCNSGCSVNYNSCVQLSMGKYLAFCDSDDIWINRNKLQLQYDFLESHPEYGMCCSEAEVGESFQRQECEAVVQDGRRIGFEELIRSHSDVYNSTLFLRRSLFLRMTKECSWFLDHNVFFDTVWAFWFGLYSQIWKMDCRLALYRQRKESDCRTQNVDKRYLLDKRYFMIKSYFLITQVLDNETKLDILLDEYDFLHKNSKYIGEQSVRNSRSYLLGNKILNAVKCIIKRK